MEKPLVLSKTLSCVTGFTYYMPRLKPGEEDVRGALVFQEGLLALGKVGFERVS